MIVKHLDNGGSFLFKAGQRRKTKFLYMFSDLSAFGNPVKKPIKIRGNYRKTMKILLEEELNEFNVNVQDGEYYEIFNPVLSRGRTAKDVKEYGRRCGKIKPEPAKLDITVTLPAGNAIKVYSIKDNYAAYIVNDDGKIFLTDDYILVEEITGVYF
jgi:hypothetical protein